MHGSIQTSEDIMTVPRRLKTPQHRFCSLVQVMSSCEVTKQLVLVIIASWHYIRSACWPRTAETSPLKSDAAATAATAACHEVHRMNGLDETTSTSGKQ